MKVIDFISFSSSVYVAKEYIYTYTLYIYINIKAILYRFVTLLCDEIALL